MCILKRAWYLQGVTAPVQGLTKRTAEALSSLHTGLHCTTTYQQQHQDFFISKHRVLSKQGGTEVCGSYVHSEQVRGCALSSQCFGSSLYIHSLAHSLLHNHALSHLLLIVSRGSSVYLQVGPKSARIEMWMMTRAATAAAAANLVWKMKVQYMM